MNYRKEDEFHNRMVTLYVGLLVLGILILVALL